MCFGDEELLFGGLDDFPNIEDILKREKMKKEIRTIEEQRKLVDEHPWNLKYIENPDDEICLEAIKKDGGVISYIPEEKQTIEMCRIAVRQHAPNIQFVKEENRTEEIFLETVKKDAMWVHYVPEDKLTEKICLEALKQDGESIKWIKNKTSKRCLYAFLNKYSVIKRKYIKAAIQDWKENGIKIDKMIFSNVSDLYSGYKEYIYEMFDENEYDLLDFELKSFDYIKDILLNKNSGNHFVLMDTTDISIIKDIALSNNELIIVNTGNIENIHKKLADKIIDVGAQMSL